MSLVDYDFYSDEEGDTSSSPAAPRSSSCNPTQPHPESSPQNEHNSLSDSEVTSNSRASTPVPITTSSRAIDASKPDNTPSRGEGRHQGFPQGAAVSPVAPADDGEQVEREADDAESEDRDRALDDERAAAEELMSRVPKGAPPKELLATIERLQHLKRRGITVNGNINTSLDFKNPYLLEKIMKVFDIDPYCSNYPPGLSDAPGAPPFEVEGEDAPFYTYIAKRQERRRQRREKQREMKEALAAASATIGPTSASTPSKTQKQSNSSASSSSVNMALNSTVHVNVAVTQAAREAVRKAEARALLLQQQQLLLHQ